MLTFYGYKRCGTSRKAENYLSKLGISYEFIDITEEPPSKDDLVNIVEQCGKPLKKFFNTSGVVYREQKIKERLPSMSEKEQIEMLASNGKLLKRPLITDGTRSSVGFNEEEFIALWK